MTDEQMRALAVEGAKIRIAQLDAERRELIEAFGEGVEPPRRGFSEAERAQISRRMKAYWRRRKEAENGGR